MSHVHYLREIAAIRKRVIYFAEELQQQSCANGKLVKSNYNSTEALYNKILNELGNLKTSTIIRYKQQYFALLPDKSELATLLALRTLKEKFFLRKITEELDKNKEKADFRSIIYTTTSADALYPSDPAEQVLKENSVAHSILVDLYVSVIDCLKDLQKYNQLLWLIQSMAVMEQKYYRNEQQYLQVKAAA